MCRRLGSPGLLLDGLNGMAYALSVRLEGSERRLACANEMLALSDAAKVGIENLQPRADLFSWKAVGCLDFGDIPGLGTALEGWSRIAEEMQEPFVFALLTVHRATLALMQGQFEGGERFAGEALALGSVYKRRTPQEFSGGKCLHCAGNKVGLRKLNLRCGSLFKETRQRLLGRPGLALIYSELGRTDEAQAEFEHLAKNDFADFPRGASARHAGA